MPEPMKKSARILIIDDDPNLRRTLSDILKIKGYEVATAEDGVGGIAEANRAVVNVALIDLKLPDMSGIEVMGQIKSGSPFTEAIVLTGYAALDTAVEAMNKGAFSYLLKPYQIDDLLLAVRHAVDRQQAQQEILRLSSFPQLSPNPIIEIDAAGEITYDNPAARSLFPDMVSAQSIHPVLSGLTEMFAVFQHEGQQEKVRQVEVGSRCYEQRISYVVESDHIRIYMLDVTERREHEIKINKLNALLLAIRDINARLLVAENEADLFQFVCQVLKRLEHTAGVVIGIKMPDDVLKPVAFAGFDEAMMSATNIRYDDSQYGRGVMGTAVRGGKPELANDLENDPRYSGWKDIVAGYMLKSAAAVPLVAEGDVMGVLAIYSRQRNAFDQEAIKFLAEVANDIAIGVHSLRLNNKLEATLKSLRKSLDGTIEAIAGMVELRDPYTAGHERRVAQLASAIGKELGLPERQVEGLRVIGYLHDIGKIAVPAEILSKPAAFTELERSLVESHAKAGYDILKNLEFPWPVAQAVLQHHERFDGSGYPQGLTAQDIIVEARIMMVADVVEAMVSHRPYRASCGLDSAIDEITRNKVKLYDPDVVDACVRLFVEQGFGLD